MSDKRFEIECELEIEATVTFIVHAESAEAALRQIEENRDYPDCLMWDDPPETQRSFITNVGEAVEAKLASTDSKVSPEKTEEPK